MRYLKMKSKKDWEKILKPNLKEKVFINTVWKLAQEDLKKVEDEHQRRIKFLEDMIQAFHNKYEKDTKMKKEYREFIKAVKNEQKLKSNNEAIYFIIDEYKKVKK